MFGRYFFSAILIIIGLGLLIDQFTAFDFGYLFSTWWPLIIILFGLLTLSSKNRSYPTGIIITIVGILILGGNLGIIRGGFWGAFWPLVIIYIGASMLFHKKRYFHFKHKKTFDDENSFSTFFSSAKQVIQAENFRGADINTMFGGMKLDLRNSKLSPEGAVVDISLSFGGVNIYIPSDWNIKIVGTPIFGGVENKTRNTSSPDLSPTLIIKYNLMFGGIEIRN